MYDTIIIGAGPAGFTAGIYAVRREMKTLILGKEVGGQVQWASEIENYPGFRSINNIDLIQNMQKQVTDLGCELKVIEVQKIEKTEDGFMVTTSKEKFETKTVIICMGLAPRRLAIEGEEKFTGRGVSYCANCDGPFYKGKTVAVVGGGNSAFDAAEVLSKIADKVYLINRSDKFRAFDVLVEEVKSKKNIEIVLNSEIEEISGQEKVEKIKILNNQTNEKREVALDGLFIEIGRVAHTDLIAGLVERDEKAQIIVDGKQATKTPGVFAAGDVVVSDFKQITIACGQATVAALAAYQYIQMKQGREVKTVLDRSVK